MAYEAVIGLECHIQLATRTKMFCECPAEFGAAPNTNVCPVCLGLPGALPVTNRAAIDSALRLGLALGCTLREESVFARKNYFDPDMPKNYQITQYDLPLCEQGALPVMIDGVARTSHPSASPSRRAASTAARFARGRAPGSPRHTGHTWVFGSPPNVPGHPQNIFVAVFSSTCTSRPITGS